MGFTETSRPAQLYEDIARRAVIASGVPIVGGGITRYYRKGIHCMDTLPLFLLPEDLAYRFAASEFPNHKEVVSIYRTTHQEGKQYSGSPWEYTILIHQQNTLGDRWIIVWLCTITA